jgi:hypothetical protein
MMVIVLAMGIKSENGETYNATTRNLWKGDWHRLGLTGDQRLDLAKEVGNKRISGTCSNTAGNCASLYDGNCIGKVL